MPIPEPPEAERLFAGCGPGDIRLPVAGEPGLGARGLGQERALEALRFGIGMKRHGYNVFAYGAPGTSKHALVRHELEQSAGAMPVPPDWCYVQNFEDQYKPRAPSLPAGRGCGPRADMAGLIEELRSAIPTAFESEDYRARIQALQVRFSERQETAFNELQERARARNVALIRTPAGLAHRDAPLREHLTRVWEENYRVYAVRKVWRQIQREGIVVARCPVARLMRERGLRGVVRGSRVETTTPVATPACPADRVNRVFQAPRPNALWRADLTDVATWAGFVHVAFVLDACARRIVCQEHEVQGHGRRAERHGAHLTGLFAYSGLSGTYPYAQGRIALEMLRRYAETPREAAGKLRAEFEQRADSAGLSHERRGRRRQGSPIVAASGMRAMVMARSPGRLELRQVAVPHPGDGQLLVKVHACGVCRADLHVIDGALAEPRLPLVPGHEIVGTVAALGRNVEQFREGARVGIPWLGWTCGECRLCRSGRENLCEPARFTGYTLDGGYREYTVADQRYCFPIPGRYGDAEAAPPLCAGLVGYRALRMAGEAERLGICGFGAAAHIVAQVARHQGRRVFAPVRPGDEAAKRFARDLGAVWAGDSEQRPPEELDAAIIFAPVGALVPLALEAVAPGGTVVCAGIHMSDIPRFPYAILWRERRLLSVANLTRRDGEGFLAPAPRIPVRTTVEKVPLARANEALRRLREGRLRGAAVLMTHD